MTLKEVSVAEAKKHFSDLLGRVAYRGERITISKRGKPMAVLVPTTEVLDQKRLSGVRGWLNPSDPFFEVIDQIVLGRKSHLPRILTSTRIPLETEKTQRPREPSISVPMQADQES